jgi:uncharacterized peroxidase-related enzyme
MSRINLPASIDAAPAGAHEALKTVKAKLGKAPNIYLLASNSPAALSGLLALSGNLAGGALDAAAREAIALTVANVNGCHYCNAAHSYIAKNLVKLSDEEISRNRDGRATDSKTDAAVRLARKITLTRGEADAADVDAAKAAGLSDAELVEVIAHVALNTFTNYLNHVFQTPVDFPAADAKRAA